MFEIKDVIIIRNIFNLTACAVQFDRLAGDAMSLRTGVRKTEHSAIGPPRRHKFQCPMNVRKHRF